MAWFTSAKEFLKKLHGGENHLDTNFTPRAVQVFALARKEAARLHLNYLGTEHLLVGLVELEAGVVAHILAKAGMNLENVRAEAEMLARGPNEKMFGNIPYTPRLKKVAVQWASEEAKALNHTFIGTEHLLLGLLRESDGPAADIFKKFDVDMEALRREILIMLSPSAD